MANISDSDKRELTREEVILLLGFDPGPPSDETITFEFSVTKDE